MKKIIAATVLGLGTLTAWAHSIDEDIAKFEKVYATKDATSNEAREAKAMVERARAYYAHSDTVQLLRIRGLLNDGFKAVGAQPAFLGSEIKRLEEAIASQKVNEAAKIDAAKKLLQQAKAEKAAYDVLHDAVGEQLKQAMKLIETAK